MMKPRECCRNCCLCASAPGSVWGFVCLGGVVCLQCLSHTGAVVTGECFPVSSEEDVWVPSDTLHGLFWGWCLCAGCKVYQRRSKSR